jgi:hypothetical protein
MQGVHLYPAPLPSSYVAGIGLTAAPSTIAGAGSTDRLCGGVFSATLGVIAANPPVQTVCSEYTVLASFYSALLLRLCLFTNVRTLNHLILKRTLKFFSPSALIKKKIKFSPPILGNSDGSSCKVIYEEGFPNI